MPNLPLPTEDNALSAYIGQNVWIIAGEFRGQTGEVVGDDESVYSCYRVTTRKGDTRHYSPYEIIAL